MSKIPITSKDLAAWEMAFALQDWQESVLFVQNLRRHLTRLGTLGKITGKNRCDCCIARTHSRLNAKGIDRPLTICQFCWDQLNPTPSWLDGLLDQKLLTTQLFKA